MAVVYATSLKNTRLDAVVAAIDAGASPGYIEIGTAAMALVVATITLGDPSGTTGAGVLTFSGFPRSDTTADASGTAAEAVIKDSDGNTIVSGLTVGTSGTDIVLSSVEISAGDTVTLNSATITHG